MDQRFGRIDEALERTVESTLEALGFELVELEAAGRTSRPILRLRIDRPGSQPGHGVSVDDCARVSRQLEEVLDAWQGLPSGYILEVSSPGVERPLRKRRDFERAVGREIALHGYEPLARGAKRLEGVLLGLEGSGGAERLRVRLPDQSEVAILRSAIAKAKLVFRWDERGRPGERRSQRSSRE
ncbi:MAG: ribosome maturation factor RimP [Gemmatimonadetes bacterium]|nr:ribosome maturation factor RimP [Gemmatimonadota bacterium]NIO30719.1 ribosome maturation factor RimP [Gemmatimonadota bacterium]